MKESKLIQMQNKIQSLTNVVEHLFQEIEYLRTVSFGTLETMTVSYTHLTLPTKA